jgi:putative heme iron utilization protein
MGAMSEDREKTPEGDGGALVRSWLLRYTAGTLCTLSADPETAGWPFGSIVPFALTARGVPLILIADIAQHTRNLRRDERASLLVHEVAAEGDPQAAGRVTLMGRMRPVEPGDPELEALHARYLERVPSAGAYFETHDFSYWWMEIARVRLIGGFGRISWLAPEAVLRDPLGAGMDAAAPRIIAHMNEDHEDALRDMVEVRGGARPARARIVAVDRAGFLVRTEAPDGLRHISFGREISAAEARDAFVALARAAREKRP